MHAVKPSRIHLLTIALLAVGIQNHASAAMNMYTDESVFNAHGPIAYSSTFSDFGTGFRYPGNNFTRGDVTYTSKENFTFGSATSYTRTETLIGNNYWTPITGTIASAPKYDLFGFSIAANGTNPYDFSIFTNVATYFYNDIAVANGLANQLSFFGFEAEVGEYITGFRIDAPQLSGALAGITNVKVGHEQATSVPEPTSIALLALGFLGFGVSHRRNQQA